MLNRNKHNSLDRWPTKTKLAITSHIKKHAQNLHYKSFISKTRWLIDYYLHKFIIIDTRKTQTHSRDHVISEMDVIGRTPLHFVVAKLFIKCGLAMLSFAF